jgi:hypothetical protein
MTGGLANPALSLFDDVLAIGGIIVAVLAPIIAAIIVLVLIVGGVRLLLIEYGPWTGPRKNWIAIAAGFSVATGMAFALALIT